MFLLLLNWLFNGLLLSIVCILALPCIINNPQSFLYNPPDVVIWGMGFGGIWILILISFSKFAYYLVLMFSQQRKPTKEEMQILQSLLSELIQKANTVKGTNFQLNNLSILVNDAPEFHSQALGSNIISISTLLLNGASAGELKAVLACELAHLYYKDGLVFSAILFGSVPSRLLKVMCDKYLCFINIGAKAFSAFKIGGIAIFSILLIIPFIVFLPLIVLNWFGSKLLDYSLRFMTRRYLSRAYKFTSDLGYSTRLIEYLS